MNPQAKSDMSEMQALRRRLLFALSALGVVYLSGSLGLYALGRGKWSMADCAYMTVISVTTVGYSEVLRGFESVPFARLFVSILLISGIGLTLYSVSALTTFLIEGQFLDLRRRRRMQKRIDQKTGHIVICGAGRTGLHIATELNKSQWPFVLIDRDLASIENCAEAVGGNLDYVVGDCTEDSVLHAAGVSRAHGVIAALPDDRDNLFVVVTTRGINEKVRVVAKAINRSTVAKLKTAGANRVVAVNRIGGHRMASEMIRPHVVEFIETMIRDKDRNLRFEEVLVPKGSPLVGKTLAETDIRKVGKILVVAAGYPGKSSYTYSPGPDLPLCEGMTLIVIGETESVQKLRDSPLFEIKEED